MKKLGIIWMLVCSFNVYAKDKPDIVWQAATPQGESKINEVKRAPSSCKFVKCSELNIGQCCKTSKEKCFKMVNDPAFKIGIQEMGDDCSHEGAIWARNLQKEEVNYEMAQSACPTGTHPPTIEDFVRLRESVGVEPNLDYKYYPDPVTNKHKLSNVGRKELDQLLPDITRHWFWSSSPIKDGKAFDFDGIDGEIYYDDPQHPYDAVRCLRTSNS